MLRLFPHIRIMFGMHSTHRIMFGMHSTHRIMFVWIYKIPLKIPTIPLILRVLKTTEKSITYSTKKSKYPYTLEKCNFTADYTHAHTHIHAYTRIVIYYILRVLRVLRVLVINIE